MESSDSDSVDSHKVSKVGRIFRLKKKKKSSKFRGAMTHRKPKVTQNCRLNANPGHTKTPSYTKKHRLPVRKTPRLHEKPQVTQKTPGYTKTRLHKTPGYTKPQVTPKPQVTLKGYTKPQGTPKNWFFYLTELERLTDGLLAAEGPGVELDLQLKGEHQGLKKWNLGQTVQNQGSNVKSY